MAKVNIYESADCKDCLHNKVCSHIKNMNVDMDCPVYLDNIVVKIQCIHYVRKSAVTVMR